MARYILIRHGESMWNGERRIQGNQDPPLSPRGRQQAECLLAHLPAHLSTPAAVVYTSPLRRAAETAERVGHRLGLDVLPEPGLREMSLGKWEGMKVPEIQAAFPGTYERWLGDPLTYPAPGGENLDAFARRVTAAFERMRAEHPGKNLVLVSHGGAIKALLCHILELPIRFLFRFKQDNTAVSIIEMDDVTRRIVLLNDTCHLTEVDVRPKDVLTDAAEEPDTAL